MIALNTIFNRLTVIEKGAKRGRHSYYLCACNCGNDKKIREDVLKNGNTQSCGCLRKELNTTHNSTGTPLYRVWKSMNQRCSNPKDSSYVDYGAKQISVCFSWKNSFVNFKNWALTHGYSTQFTIDRLDNTKGYFPQNCRWASKTTQARNRGKFKNNTTGFTGISFQKSSGKYLANITVNKSRIFLGAFSTAQLAAKIRQNYIKQNHLQNFQE